EYVVFSLSPVSVKERFVKVPMFVLSRRILYPVTATLSVEAVQERLIWLVETAVAVRFAGVDGGVVSAAGTLSPHSAGRSLPTHDGLLPAPLLSEISIGVGFRFRYQMLDAPAAVESGALASLWMSAKESLAE